MLYELRMYHPAPGRLEDLVERIGSVMAPYFERHDFPPRLGMWTAVAGTPIPLFAWLLKWRDFAHRAAAFASLSVDQEWNAVRIKTNGDSEMVRRYDLRFLTPSEAWLPLAPVSTSSCRLVELRVQAVAVGRTGAASDVLATVDLPALASSGTTVAGVFDNHSGPATPGITMLLGWSDFDRRRESLAAYEQSSEVVAARLNERDRWAGDHLLAERASLLLEPTRHSPRELKLL